MSEGNKTPFQGFSSRGARHEVAAPAALPKGEKQ